MASDGRWFLRTGIMMFVTGLLALVWLALASAQDLRLPTKETAIQVTPQGKVLPVPQAPATERTNASATIPNATITWTPSAGAVSFELYMWAGYMWMRAGTSSQPSFTFAPPAGIYRWMAVDILADGTRVYQRQKGSWTDVPYTTTAGAPRPPAKQ